MAQVKQKPNLVLQKAFTTEALPVTAHASIPIFQPKPCPRDNYYPKYFMLGFSLFRLHRVATVSPFGGQWLTLCL